MSLELVRRWFDSLPEHERDLPLILVDGKVYTPREVLREVERGTPLGEKMQATLEMAISGSYTFEELRVIGKARAKEIAKRLPKDFSLIAIGKGEVTRDEIIEMIQREESLGKSAIDYEAERAMKLLTMRW